MKNFLTLLVFLFLLVSCNLASGSYPYAERYNINLPEIELAYKIENFKNNNPEYIVPVELGLEDGRRTEIEHWYHIYFNVPEKNKIFLTWVRKKSKTETTFAFVSVQNYSGLGNWKLINKDYKKPENKKVIKEFEENILSKLDIDKFIQK